MPDAAVATGTCAIAWKLPAFIGSVGTAEQPEPNSPATIAGLDVMADEGALAGGFAFCASPASLPQAATVKANAATAATATNFGRRMVDPFGENVCAEGIRIYPPPGLVGLGNFLPITRT
ncbi:hypothetical protein Ais01nite_49100 [Asanoa ishikariensis]|nr:hypothetical protein Ais01nite_49100 [Asanoa ishikariensis]